MPISSENLRGELLRSLRNLIATVGVDVLGVRM